MHFEKKARLVPAIAFMFFLPACGLELGPGATNEPAAHEPATIEPANTDSVTIEPAAPVPQKLTIATFNVLKLFDNVCDSGSCGPSDFETQYSSTEYNKKLNKVAEGIRKLNAEVVFLQEVESPKAIGDLHSRLKDLYSSYVIGEGIHKGSLNTAILYNGELLFTLFHDDLTAGNSSIPYFSRIFIELQLAVDPVAQEAKKPDLIVFCAHFRSKAGADDGARRLAEAKTAHDYLVERAGQYPEALIVMGGDLNDYPGSEPLKALEEDGELLRVAAELPEKEQATYYYGGATYALDHLFMAKKAAGAYISGTAAVVFDAAGKSGYAGSDHAALKADFMLHPEASAP